MNYLLLEEDKMVAVLRKKEVSSRAGLGETQIKTLVRENKFPTPVQLGPNSVGWYEHEVDEWLLDRPRVEWDSMKKTQNGS